MKFRKSLYQSLNDNVRHDTHREIQVIEGLIVRSLPDQSATKCDHG